MRIHPYLVRTRLALMPAIWILGCGGSPSAPSASTTAESQTTTIDDHVEAYGTNTHEFTTTRAGLLTGDLTWTDTADLDLYLTDGSCVGDRPDDCALLGKSIASNGSHEVVTRTVSANEHYRLWIDNFTVSDGANYKLVITVK